MQNLTYKPGENARFYCDIVGQPIPKFTWHRGDKPIKEERGKYRIKSELWGGM